MASSSDPMFEEKVYLAFKAILKGPRAEIRRSKVVLPIIEEHKHHTRINALLQTHSKATVCQSLCLLLKDNVFQSEEKAKQRFATNPPIAAQPPSESGASVVSEIPSMIGLLEAPAAASLIETDMTKSESSKLGAVQEGSVLEIDSMDEYEDSSDSDGIIMDKQEMDNYAPAPHESKYPTETSQLQVSLPLRIQNILLSRIQAILEFACFEFAKERMPGILESRKWHCQKAGELNLWVREFNKRMDAFKSNINNPGYEISTCFQTATHIRHSAVHRRHLSTAHLQSLVNNAEGLCKILGNNQALAQIELIWGYAQAQISELESLKQEIVVDLESSLDDIAARRAELDLLEAESIAKAHDKLSGHHDLASDELEKILLDRHMILIAAGKVEVEKEGDEADDDDAHVPEEIDDQPPEEAKVEQHQPPSSALHILQHRIKPSMLLAQEIYNRLNSLATCLRTVCNPILLLSSILFGIAAAYILGPGGMEHMWSVLWWGEW